MLNLRIAIEIAIHNVAHQPALTKTLNLASSLPQPVSPTTELGVPNGKPDTPNRDTILKLMITCLSSRGSSSLKSALPIYWCWKPKTTTRILFVTTTRRYILRLSLSAALDRLNHPQMVRVHRSFAVNVRRVDTFDEQTVTLNGYPVLLGKNDKDDFMQSLHAG